MDAKELRIWNYVIDMCDGNACQITSGMMIDDGLVFMEPIPITEDWLLDFGFEKVKTEIGPPINDVWDSFEKEEVKLTKYVDFKNKGWMLENVCSIFTPDLKYVHQLQNLYYSLTGEELIKK